MAKRQQRFDQTSAAPDAEEALLDDILDPAPPGDDPLETDHMPAARAIRLQARYRYERIRRREQLLKVIPRPPAPGQSVHLVGTGLFDFWTFVPQMVAWIGRAEELWLSSWTIARPNCVELFELMDRGLTGRVSYVSGLYFKRRETGVYLFLLSGLQKRGGRFLAFENHAKITLLKNTAKNAWITCEGSANLTANPRLEQYVITNDRGLYEFHAAWMDEAFAYAYARAKPGGSDVIRPVS